MIYCDWWLFQLYGTTIVVCVERKIWRLTLYSHTHQLIIAILVAENWVSSAKNTWQSSTIFQQPHRPYPHSEIHQWGGTSLPLLKVGYIEYLCQAVSDIVQPSFCCAQQKWSSTKGIPRSCQVLPLSQQGRPRSALFNEQTSVTVFVAKKCVERFVKLDDGSNVATFSWGFYMNL